MDMRRDSPTNATASVDQGVLEEPGMMWGYAPRLRFAFTVGIYGAAVGAFAIIVNFLSQTRFPLEPQHMTMGRTVLFSISGGIGGFLVTVPFAFWMYASPSALYEDTFRKPFGIVAWIFLGLGFGLVYPLLMGAYLLPTTFNLLDFATGFATPRQVLNGSADTIIVGPYLAIVLGVEFFFTGLFAGVLFGAGGWVVDQFNSSADQATAKYGSWAIALSLAIMAS